LSTELSAERCREALQDHTRRLAEHAGAAASDAAVPTCPGWTVRSLAEHVGQTQHWVAEIIESRITDPTKLPMEMVPLPAAPEDWPAWLSESAARVATACTDEALEAPVFNAAADGRTGGRFWLHSMLNEAVIHGFDAAAAAGRDYDADADVAAFLISNHLAMLTSPTWAAQRPESATAISGTGQTLQLHATDEPVSGDWHIERGSDGARWQPRQAAADVTVHGPAKSLLLTLTRRIPLTDGQVTIDGDVELARHWVQNTAHVAG
jgi:uncharacterized protein (TIGR03083 family)